MSFAGAYGIFGRRFHRSGCAFLMICNPRFGFLLRICKARVIGCFTAAVDEAVDELKSLGHVQCLLNAGFSYRQAVRSQTVRKYKLIDPLKSTEYKAEES